MKNSIKSIYYFIIVLIFGLHSFHTLTEKQSESILAIKKATLFYYGKSESHSTLATGIIQAFGTSSVDLSQPGAGEKVRSLTGSDKISSPTLIWTNNNHTTIVSGVSAVKQSVKSALLNESPLTKGRIAIILIISLVGLGILYTDEIYKSAGYAVFLCLFGLTAVLGKCISCHTGTNNLILSLVPVFGLFYTSFSALLFSSGKKFPRWSYTICLFTSRVFPIIQSVLLLIEPKLCFGCMLMTAASIIYSSASLKALKNGAVVCLKTPNSLKIISIIWLSLLFIRQGLVLNGTVQLEPGEENVPNIIGRKWSDISYKNHVLAKTLILVSQKGCSSCEIASKDLTEIGISWQKVPICNTLESENCFNGAGLSFPTPMLLVVDERGVITFQYNGWPSPGAERDTLLQQLRATLLSPNTSSLTKENQ
jgi:hypothetical protein